MPRITFWPLLAGALLLAAPHFCQAQSQSKADASLRVEYQYITTGDFKAETRTGDYWTTDAHVGLISGDYALSERWTVYAALPYVRKRFNAGDLDFGTGPGDPHNPNSDYWIDFVPPDKRFWDDGEYHGDWQDLSLGIMYKMVDGPAWTVSPFVGYAVPASDYPFYAKSAIGTNLWNIPIGVDIGFIPYFSDWHFRGNLAYVFSEEPLGVDVDYWLAYLSAGYWFKPDFSMNVFLSSKYLRNGLIIDYDFGVVFPDDFDTEKWWQHDRLIRHRILNMGIGFDFFMNERYQLSGSYFQTIWLEQTNEVDDAFTLALTRFFGHD